MIKSFIMNDFSKMAQVKLDINCVNLKMKVSYITLDISLKTKQVIFDNEMLQKRTFKVNLT